jgi:hypothetical protein
MSIKVHEFSTGIRPEKTAEGGWVSRGFTSQYMNATCDSVPYEIERSIANFDFSIAEGTASEAPAIIGRIVTGPSDDPQKLVEWSVVALVSRGRDEKGRSGSFSRYFFVEGADFIPQILAWLCARHYPVFNPFDIKKIGDEHVLSGDEPLHKLFLPESKEITNEHLESRYTMPVIFPSDVFNPEFLHAFATAKAKRIKESTGQETQISWAFNVEAVEKIERFTAIRPASISAKHILEKSKQTISATVSLGVMFDEEKIKTALKGMINSSNIKENYFLDFAKALCDRQVDPHWPRIFNALGAKNAIERNIYNSQMIKLLVLRSIAIREMEDYIHWIGKGNVDSRSIAESFEEAVVSSNTDLGHNHPKLSEQVNSNLVAGFFNVVNIPLSDPKKSHKLNVIKSLFRQKSPHRLLSNQSRKFLHELRSDLKNVLKYENRSPVEQEVNEKYTVAQNDVHQRNDWNSSVPNDLIQLLSLGEWLSVYTDIWQYHHGGRTKKPHYLELAKTFEIVGQDFIAAVFYTVAQDIVPEKLFNKLIRHKDSHRDSHDRSVLSIHGITIRREASTIEKCGKALNDVCDSLKNQIYKEETDDMKTLPVLAFVALSAFVSYNIGNSRWISEQVGKGVISSSPSGSPSSSDKSSKNPSLKQQDQLKNEIATAINSIVISSKKSPALTPSPSYSISNSLSSMNCGSRSIEAFLKALDIKNPSKEISDMCKIINYHDSAYVTPSMDSLKSEIEKSLKDTKNKATAHWGILKQKIIDKQDKLVQNKDNYQNKKDNFNIINIREGKFQSRAAIEMELVDVSEIYTLITESAPSPGKK